MEAIPNKAPQKAYILQPVEKRKEEGIPLTSVFFFLFVCLEVYELHK